MLPGKRIQDGRVIVSYLYVTADARYSIDLRTGKARGPLRSGATIIPRRSP